MPDGRLGGYLDAVAMKGTRQPPETPRDRLWTAIYVVAAIAVLSGLGGFLTYLSVHDVIGNQTEAEVRGYKIRAAECSAILYQGWRIDDLPKICRDPAVIPFVEGPPAGAVPR